MMKKMNKKSIMAIVFAAMFVFASVAGIFLPKQASAVGKRGKIRTIKVTSVKNVVKVVTDNLGTIDDKILSSLVNWKLDRISKVNLTILRLAVGEMLFIEDVPGGAAINEAIELTKKYSDDKSSSFINGVLDKILKTLEQ